MLHITMNGHCSSTKLKGIDKPISAYALEPNLKFGRMFYIKGIHKLHQNSSSVTLRQ